MKRKLIMGFFVLIFYSVLVLLYFQYRSRAAAQKANLIINTRKIVGPLYFNWRALAQGGEESGVRMLGGVTSALMELSLRYIRLDHIYDFYDVVSRNATGKLEFNWDKLDATVCDIYASGAKPFLSLGYMPPALSSDGSLVSVPKDWNEWSLLTQKTIERYSGKSTVLCGNITGDRLSNAAYEVWNEPDGFNFGAWSIRGGAKDYKTLYFYTSQGAAQAKDVYFFYLGGPSSTSAYKSWFQTLLNYVAKNNLRIDFLSWHHYTKNPSDYVNDVKNIESWLPCDQYGRYCRLPKMITEWGYDSEPNPIADTDVGAAYTIASARNIIDQRLELAFSFEAKDGQNPSWGILSHDGTKKPRYHALKFLNILEGYRLDVAGEGTYVSAVASYSPRKTAVVLVNYDKDGRNTEAVPILFTNLAPGSYQMVLNYLSGTKTTFDNIVVIDGNLRRSILMPPNSVIALELMKK